MADPLQPGDVARVEKFVQSQLLHPSAYSAAEDLAAVDRVLTALSRVVDLLDSMEQEWRMYGRVYRTRRAAEIDGELAGGAVESRYTTPWATEEGSK